MTLPEDMIIDLLPAYFTGDASQASRTVIEAYFAQHPRFAQQMRAIHEAPVVLPESTRDDAGKEAVRRVRKRLRRHSVLMALAIACSALPCSFIVKDGVLVYAVWRDAPAVAFAYAGIAVVAWLAFALARRSDALPRHSPLSEP